MNDHLSKEQFAGYALGERHPQVQQHLSDCDACSSEVQRFQFAVGDLRACMYQIGESEYGQRAFHSRRHRVCPHSTPLSLVRSAAVLLGFLLISFFTGHHFGAKQPTADAPKAQAAATSDADLWAEVEDQTSRTAAPAMDPLLGTAEQYEPAPQADGSHQ